MSISNPSFAMDLTDRDCHLTDSHCHLTFAPLAEHLDAVIERANQRQVTRIIVPSYDRPSWTDVARVAKRARVYAAFGIHPWVASSPFELSDLRAHLIREKAVAVGEIGLDFKVDVAREIQMRILISQLQCALDLELPVLLHVRGAFEEMLALLSTMKPRPRGVVHAFSKGPDLMRRFIDLGFHIAFGGAVTRRNASKVRASAAAIPLERLLLETDAPSIGLEGISPKAVEPAHVADIAAVVADLRGEPVSRIASITTQNACALFGQRVLK